MAKRFSKIAILLMLVLALLVPMMVMSVGAAEEETATISFASTAQRVSQTSESQVWKNGDVTFTNNKAGSSTPVANYSNPVRIYAKSEIVFGCSAGNITKIVVNCNNTTYATALAGSVTSGGTATASGTVVTITPATPSDTFTIPSISAQTRFNSLTVYYEGSDEPACEHTNTTTTTVDATCTTDGSTTVTCNDCGETVSTETIPATGHSYDENGECENCDSKLFMPTFNVLGEVKDFDITLAETIELPTVTDVVEGYEFAGWVTNEYSSETTGVAFKAPGEKVNLTSEVTYYALFSRESKTSGFVWKLVTDASKLIANYDDPMRVIIAAKDSDVAISTTQNNNNRSQANISKNDDTITFGNDVQIFDLLAGTSTGTFGFFDTNENGFIYAASSSSNYLRTESTLSANSSWKITISADGTATIVAQGTNTRKNLQYNKNSSIFSCYSTTQQAVCIYYEVEDIVTTTSYTTAPKAPECDHSDATETVVDPTCENNGYTKIECDCGYIDYKDEVPALGHDWSVVSVTKPTCTTGGSTTYDCTRCDNTKLEEHPATGHNYMGGICVKCFNKESITGNATLTFDTTDNRVSWDADSQVWYANGITVTNKKAGSTSAIVDSSNPVRFYKNSVVTVECSDMTVITFNCDTADYATALYNSITGSEEYTVASDEKTVTVTFVAATNSFEVTLSEGQVRVDSIEVTSTLKDKIVGASLYIGNNLSMLYNVVTVNDINDYTMVFSFNGKTFEVPATQIDENYYFVLDAIAPNLMGEDIKAELYCGDECVAVKEAYSVLEYCEYFLKGEGSANCSAELKELLANLLEYGAAAQQYKSETELGAEDLVNNGVTGAKEYECTENVKAVTGDAAIIAGAGVSFGVDNKVYFRLVENYEEIFGAVTVKINGEDAEIVGGYIYTEGVKATELSTVFTLEISVGETVIKTAKYSITSYVTIIGAGTSEGAALARALYNYGCSAKNYMGV